MNICLLFFKIKDTENTTKITWKEKNKQQFKPFNITESLVFSIVLSTLVRRTTVSEWKVV